MKNNKNLRHIMAGGMFLLAMLLYVDRVCISVAKDNIAQELLLSDKQMGWVLSIFALGYALFQIPSGALADRYGPRIVLSGIVSIWSVLTAVTGYAWNYMSLIVVRFLFGAGEAGAFPGMSQVIYSWLPVKERGIVLGINFSGSRLGAAFALPLVAWLIEGYGWRTSFLILGGVGIIWAILWWIGFRNLPEDHPAISEEEVAYIQENRQKKVEAESTTALSFGALSRSKNLWSTSAQYFSSNFTFFFALTWLFPHLKEKYQLESLEAGVYAIAPFICGAIGNWLSGWLVDRLYAQKRWNASRRIPAIVGFLLASFGLLGSIFMTTPLGAVVMLSIAILGADMTLPPSWALCVDIGKDQSGTISGTMNMAGNVGSFLTALAFPYLTAWTGSVDMFFYTAAGLNLLAVFLWIGIKADRGLAY
ncbi:MAG: MFS transporter [Bacteroidota bacterium]